MQLNQDHVCMSVWYLHTHTCMRKLYFVTVYWPICSSHHLFFFFVLHTGKHTLETLWERVLQVAEGEFFPRTPPSWLMTRLHDGEKKQQEDSWHVHARTHTHTSSHIFRLTVYTHQYSLETDVLHYTWIWYPWKMDRLVFAVHTSSQKHTHTHTINI